MGHLVITIGCEYGAKGNAIGRKIAEDLGIKFYDRELVDQIIEEVGIPKDIMNRVEEGGTIAGKGAEGDVRGSFSKYADLTERAIHVQKQITGITRVFQDENVSLDYEFMNIKQVDDEDSVRLFHDWLAYRLSVQEPYDAIILGDDPALEFAMEYQEELFSGIPMVFMGVNDAGLAKEAVENPFD